MYSCTGSVFVYILLIYLSNVLGDFLGEAFIGRSSFFFNVLVFIILCSIYNAIAKKRNWGHGRIYTEHYQRSDFMNSLLILSAAVIKADGRFAKSEMNYLKSYLVRSFGTEAASDALWQLREIMQENYNIPSVCAELRQGSTIHERLLILQFLFGLANADGEISRLEVAEIENIATWMGVSRNDYESIKSMFVGGYSGYGYSSSNSGGGSTYRSHTLDDDYKILGITPDASDDDVKKAYRTLAKKYHPDRVAHLGEDMRKQAEEKFAKLSDAYDRIKKSRGIK